MGAGHSQPPQSNAPANPQNPNIILLGAVHIQPLDIIETNLHLSPRLLGIFGNPQKY
jgi:hypothetical protein